MELGVYSTTNGMPVFLQFASHQKHLPVKNAGSSLHARADILGPLRKRAVNINFYKHLRHF